MLTIRVQCPEAWDEEKEEFIEAVDTVLHLEHSLVSLSKWEEKYHKSYIDTKEKTPEEVYDYIKMMCLDDVPEDVFRCLSEADIKAILAYIEDPHTATTVTDPPDKKEKKKQILTSELIYYYMTALNIPFECQYWHLNRLITLIKVCSVENDPDKDKPKKLTSSDLANRRARMEAARARYRKH